MRIGIITLPLHINYGGILQNFALQRVLTKMGHEVTTLEEVYSYKPSIKIRYWIYFKRIFQRVVFRKKNEIFFEKNEEERYKLISKEIRCFIKKYIQLKRYYSFKQISDTEYDAFVVGSDQIWRPKYFPRIENAFLAFAEKWKILRIAYAASFGTNKWEYNKKQTKRCKKLLNLFEGISVREKEGEVLCYEYFAQTAQYVLDPTLLLTKEDYLKIMSTDNTSRSKGTLLVYMLDNSLEKCSVVNQIVATKKLTPFTVNNSNVYNHELDISERILPSIEEWIRGFYDAEFIVTDSFHACVFSIIFQKPFLVYGNIQRGLSRFTSLLSLFHLENRMILKASDYNKVLEKDINWVEVMEILNTKQEESLNFLKFHLNKENY